jgi:hypothetical protein
MALNSTVLELVLELQSLTNQISQAMERFSQSQKMGQMAALLLIGGQQPRGEARAAKLALAGLQEPQQFQQVAVEAEEPLTAAMLALLRAAQEVKVVVSQQEHLADPLRKTDLTQPPERAEITEGRRELALTRVPVCLAHAPAEETQQEVLAV